MSNKLDELHIPPEVHLDGQPQELVRFWLCDGADHVSLRIGTLLPAEHEPEIWGSVIADIAKHAGIALQQDDPSRGDLPTIVARIERGFRERLDQDVNLSGKINRATH